MKYKPNNRQKWTSSSPGQDRKQKCRSQVFYMISNQCHNRGKTSVSCIVNIPEVITPSSDKAKLFASLFTSNSMSEDKDHPLPDFHCLTEQNRSNIFITGRTLKSVILRRLAVKIRSHFWS